MSARIKSLAINKRQQIPAKFDVIRMAFSAGKDRLLASCDISGQELRLLAVVTKDEMLIEAFKNGADIHSTITAKYRGINYDLFEDFRNFKGDSPEETEANIENIIAKWSNTPELEDAVKYYALTHTEDVSGLNKETITTLSEFFEYLRKINKPVLFSVIYGATEHGVASNMDISTEEAKDMIDGIKASIPRYLEWERETQEQVLTKGFVESLNGRKRRFGATIAEAKKDPQFKKTGHHWKINRCLRQAGNSQIQSSAADQVKMAMINLFYPKRPDGSLCFDRREWVANGYQSLLEEHDSYLVMQIHDELVINCPNEISWDSLCQFSNTLCTSMPIPVDLEFKSDIEAAPYWGGKFNRNELAQIASGELDWKEVFKQEVEKKLHKFGIDYELGDFMEQEDEEE